MKVLRVMLMVLMLAAAPALAGEAIVDCSKVVARIRALHGLNNGPLDVGGTVDLSEFHRALKIPYTRLHDAHWPNPDVVDMHAVFPDWAADPHDPRSYDFVRTDEYVAAVVKTGAKVVYRLGESIEHGTDRRRVRPPDAGKFAAVCGNIIRHYNEGWTEGQRYGIHYWEIWNEPDNRPAMWTGSDEDYFRLYVTAAKEIKRNFPEVKVGGPAIGNTGEMNHGRLVPPPFLVKFLEHCRRESAPLDFFSWHLYSARPGAIAERARGVRELLDQQGFEKAESHLNEWNYLPDDDWGPLLVKGQGEKRERFYERIGGAEGAAFAAAALVHLQDAPVDVVNYYAGDTNPFGLFTRHGVPRKNYHAMRAVAMMTERPERVAVEKRGDIVAMAGTARDVEEVLVLIVNLNARDDRIDLHVRQLPWGAESRLEWLILDEKRDLELSATDLVPAGDLHVRREVRGPSVCLVKVRPTEKAEER